MHESANASDRREREHRSGLGRWIFLLAVLICLVLATAELLISAVNVIFLVAAGLLFGVLLHGISDLIRRKFSISYRAAYASTVCVSLLAVALGIFYLGSQVVRRADRFASQVSESTQDVAERLQEYPWWNDLISGSQSWEKVAASKSGQWLPAMFDGLQWASWLATGVLVVLFVGLYAAYEPELYRGGLLKLVPDGRRSQARDLLGRLGFAMRRWLWGRFLSMSMVGILTAIALWILGVPMPVTLGVLAAGLTFIPNIGPLLAAVPQVLLAISLGTQTIVMVILFNLALQGVESYLITPMIQRKEVALPPVLTIAMQLLLGVLFGILGVMLAAPLVVTAMVLAEQLLINEGTRPERQESNDN